MTGPDLLHAAPGFSLPALERLAPAPPPALIASRIEAHSRPGEIVVDLFGRGGWVARSALDRQRRAATFESSPLTRLLAEVVLRPPDIRHLDAAFQVVATSPHGQTTLHAALGDLFATRCATCGRTVVADELIWESDADSGRQAGHPVRRYYRCSICRDQLGGSEQRHAAVEEADLLRAEEVDRDSRARAVIRERFPVLDGNESVVDQLLDLHTPRQLVALVSILDRIEGDLRAAPVEAALRLALLQALLPSSRLNGFPGRMSNLRIVGGRVKLPAGGQWRERNPWVAFEDGYRLIRGFVQRLEGTPVGAAQARFREDLASVAETPSGVLVRLGAVASLRGVAEDAARAGGSGRQGRVSLVLGQPPLRPSQDRLSYGYFATAWVLGQAAAEQLPLAPLFRSSAKLRWGWQSAQLERTFKAATPILARDARTVLVLEEGGAEALVAAVLGVVGAGFRLVGAQVDDLDAGGAGLVEFVPPGGVAPPGPRTRANVSLPPLPGGAGDPHYAPGRGLFSPPAPIDRGSFSTADATATITEAAVEILQARGEPAGQSRLLGEILVSLDRAGHLRRLVRAALEQALTPEPPDAAQDDGGEEPDASGTAGADASGADQAEDGTRGPTQAAASTNGSRPGLSVRGGGGGLRSRDPGRGAKGTGSGGHARTDDPDAGPWNWALDNLLGLIHGELERPTNRRLTQIEPGSWWLVDHDDQRGAALPLADRVEWAVFSLLSTAGRLSQTTLNERVEAMFTGHDRPDDGLVRACVESYRSPASTAAHLVTDEDIPRRAQEHAELLARLADLGHRLGMSVWIGARDQARTAFGHRLIAWMDDRERRVNLTSVLRAPEEEVEDVPCVWYVRSKVAFAFEPIWTAMLGEPLLRRHARIPHDDRLVRFLVIAPERAALVRYKLEHSALLRRSLETGNWHVLKSNHLRTLASRDEVTLEDLQPYLGLDPEVERDSLQMPLFSP